MWRSKKFLYSMLLTVVVLGGILGGVATAYADDEDTSQPPAGDVTFLDKVAEIYETNTGVAVDSEELQNAFDEARNELGIQARDRLHQRLIEEGVLSQEQLDELEQWMQSRPDFQTEEFEEWMESRPDIDLPFGPGNEDGRKRFGNMFRSFRGFANRFGGGPHGWCVPYAPAE
ncbi:MAG: hypothetical protein KAS25_00490 [Dehalococcoidales bacterium]|nr:hypothetical protein [Dehalococcoidales bacterium]